ncbi:MAG: hypothetical protein ACWGSQ_11150 [Longimicrobiales bacterium]
MPKPRSFLPLLLPLLASACASAGDRLEQGIEAEAYGRWYQAANRYIEALEKDSRMTEARNRLLEVGDSAITESLRTTEARLETGDPVGAGEEVQRIDRLMARALGVGVRLPAPEDYPDTRRRTFDAAIDELLAAGGDARARGEWDRGRNAYARLRNDFEPTASQRRESLDAESGLLLDWAYAEERAFHFRRAFGLADEAMEVAALARGRQTPGDPVEGAVDDGGDLIGAALALQDRAVAAGTLGMAVFPITEASALEDRGNVAPAQLLSDILELEHWRQPPLFIAVADPILVRTLSRRFTPGGALLRPERVLEELGADFGVLIEIFEWTVTEENVRRRTRTARTPRGATVSYTEEDGTLRIAVTTDILVVGRDGRELEHFPLTEDEGGGFERGVYEGDPRALELSRSEARLFDPVVQAQQRAVVEDALMHRLAERIAREVYRRVLSRIP